MTPLEKLTAEDKHLIQAYIRSYGEGSENNETEMIKTERERVPIDYLLRIWNNQKSYFLDKIFGDNLIIKRPIEYAAPYEDHRDEIEQLLQHPVCEKIWQRGYNCKNYSKFLWDEDDGVDYEDYISFYNAFGELINPYEKFNIKQSGTFNKFIKLTGVEGDAWDNIYSGETFSVQLPNKKLIKIPHGTKWIRAIIKVARYLDIDEDLIEDLRQQHSMCTNTKILKGNMCFSIHPLDYMTMSDANFSSCMNWMERGAYRRGTVEMMNSQCVVVVYLESEHERLEFWDDIEGATAYWNMKKWRTLLMVTPSHITSIKSYPYECDELSVTAVSIMAQLVEHKYDEIIYNSETSEFSTSYWKWTNNETDNRYEIQFGADGAMYCDMGCTTHFMIRSNLFDYSKSTYFNYCGPTECMFCGEICSSDDYGDESILYCRDCQSSYGDEDICYCTECSRRLWVDDAYWSEYANEYYCPDCYNKYLIHCVACGDNVPIYQSVPIVLSYKGLVSKNTKWNIAEFIDDEERPLPSDGGICKECVWRIRDFLTNGELLNSSGWRTAMVKSWIEDTECSSKNLKFKVADNKEYIELPYDKNDPKKPIYLYRTFNIWDEADARKVWDYQEKWREEEDPT